MTQIKESNSIFTELNSEDAASINGGGWDFKVTAIEGQPNHYLVKKFVNGEHRWTATVNNCGTVDKLRDDIVSFDPACKPKNPSYARAQAKKNVREHINGC